MSHRSHGRAGFVALMLVCHALPALAQDRAHITSPAANGTLVQGEAIQWSSAPGALAYYLYVGSQPGLKDFVDTGEIQQLSHVPGQLPAGRRVYARLWTKFSGDWRASDREFTTAAATSAGPAQLLSPAAGEEIAGGAATFRWSESSSALAYYLYVGTTQGAKDVVDSGEVSTTSQTWTLPFGRTLYARLWTRYVDRWVFHDVVFRTAPVVRWEWPREGAVDVPRRIELRGTEVAGASSYRFSLGLTEGGLQLLDVAVSTPTYDVDLPAGMMVFARLAVNVDGVWHEQRIRFSTAGTHSQAWARFVYPVDGMSGVGRNIRFEWTPVPGAVSYYLYVGKRPGLADVVNYGEVQATSVDVTGVPAGPLFARIWTRFAHGWKQTDIAFTTEPSSSSPALLYPNAAQASDVSMDFPLRWLAVNGADFYRLQLGRAAGAADLLDTGEIATTRRFVSGLPAGRQVFGRLGARVAGVWRWSSFSFVAGTTSGTVEPRIDAALALASEVRGMADAHNIVEPNTELARLVADAGRSTAFCNDYAKALLNLIQDAIPGLQARSHNVCLNWSNGYDCHTLTRVLHPRTQKWLLLDPTVAMAPVDEATRDFVTPDAMAAMAASQSFSSLRFQFLAPGGDYWPKGYYLDYPLVYLGQTAGQSPLEVMDYVGTTVAGGVVAYAVQCLDSTATAIVDGVSWLLPCAGADRLTHVFYAASISPAPGARIAIWRPRRYVF